jgi:putative transposase
MAEVARMYQLSPKRQEPVHRCLRFGRFLDLLIEPALPLAAADRGCSLKRRKAFFKKSSSSQAAGVGRAGYYRFLRRPQRKEADMDLRSRIQRIALQWPAYGYRRVHAELRKQGWEVNHKRVLRLMRADNLLCLRRRKFILTTDSKHGLRIYPNPSQGYGADAHQSAVGRRQHLHPLASGVRVLGGSAGCLFTTLPRLGLQRSLEAALVLEALRRALRQRRPRPGLVHHSDRGVQYAALDYTARLEQHGIRISMSRRGNVYDNARAESFIKTLKYEEVYRTEYRNLEEAKASIKTFLEKIYNQERLHSALGYRPPLEFEQSLSVSSRSKRGAAAWRAARAKVRRK